MWNGPLVLGLRTNFYAYNPEHVMKAKYADEWIGKQAEVWDGRESYVITPKLRIVVPKDSLDTLERIETFARLMAGAERFYWATLDTSPADNNELLHQLEIQ